jgi:hypothetical protein
MTPHDDRRQSAATTVFDAIALGLQAVCEGAGLLIEGLVSLLGVLG